jgi:glucose-6-phosphate-specific signal transduction histidine kinase
LVYLAPVSAIRTFRNGPARATRQACHRGRGFDVATTSRGNGLTNTEDRLDALGGTLHIASSPGMGRLCAPPFPSPTPRRSLSEAIWGRPAHGTKLYAMLAEGGLPRRAN